MIYSDFKSLHKILDTTRFSPIEIAEVELACRLDVPNDKTLPLIRAAFEELQRLTERNTSIDAHTMALGSFLRQFPTLPESQSVKFPEYFGLYMAFHRHVSSLKSESKIEDAQTLKRLDPHDAYKTFRYWRAPHLKDDVRHLTRVVQDGPYPFTGMNQELRDALVLLYVAGFDWSLIDQVFPGIYNEYYARSHTVAKEKHLDDIRFGYPWYAFELPVVTEDAAFHEAMQIQPGHIVLDPLTGTARNLMPLAKKYHLTQFVGLDINPENLRVSLEEARRNRFSFDRVWFSAQDALDPYDFANDSFDRIVINNYSTFNFSPDQLRHFFSEMGRLLKPEGRLWLDFEPYPSPTGNDMRQILINTWIDEDVLFYKVPVGGRWKNSDRVSVFEVIDKKPRSEVILPPKRRLSLNSDHALKPRTRGNNARIKTTPVGWKGMSRFVP